MYERCCDKLLSSIAVLCVFCALVIGVVLFLSIWLKFHVYIIEYNAFYASVQIGFKFTYNYIFYILCLHFHSHSEIAS